MDALNFMMRDTRMPHEIRTRVRDYFRKSKKMLKRMSYDVLIDRCLPHELRGDARVVVRHVDEHQRVQLVRLHRGSGAESGADTARTGLALLPRAE